MNREIYLSDLEGPACRLAMDRVYREKDRFQTTAEISAVWHRAYVPYFLAKIHNRLLSKGYSVKQQKSTIPRPTEVRARDRFVRVVKYAIENAKIRLD